MTCTTTETPSFSIPPSTRFPCCLFLVKPSPPSAPGTHSSVFCPCSFALAGCRKIESYSMWPFKTIYYLTCVWLRRVVAAAVLFSRCGEQGLLSSCDAPAFHRGGLCCWGARALADGASGVATHGLSSFSSQTLEHRLGRCGPRAELPRGMWDLPGPGIELVSPALTGRCFIMGPPGKPPACGLRGGCFHWPDEHVTSISPPCVVSISH